MIKMDEKKFLCLGCQKSKCAPEWLIKMEYFAGSRKVAHILKVWSLLSTKIAISSKSVGDDSFSSKL
jgi:hypothetical protein